jgi:hypothetical protein
LSIGMLYADPHLRALISEEIPHPIQEVLFARSRDEITNAFANTAQLIGFAKTMGEQGADIARYWEDILHAQFVLSRHWVPPYGPPPPTPKKRGRPRGHRDIPDDDLFIKMMNGKAQWFRDHPRATTMTQGQLLEAMNIYAPGDSTRVRHWCRRLYIKWENFSQRDDVSAHP